MVEGIGFTSTPTPSLALSDKLPRGLKVPDKDASNQEIRAVAEQMEGVFFSMFVKEMRKTMIDGSLFGDGPGAETYEGFFDQMMGEQLGRTGGLGIAEMVVKNAMLNRERVTIGELQSSMAQPIEEEIADIDAVNKERETNERPKTEKSERS